MIKLVPMSEEEYREYIEFAIQDYAQQQVKAGICQFKDAIQLARKAFQILLSDGAASLNQYLCTIRDDSLGKPAGFLWYGLRDSKIGRFVVLYDIVVFEEYRRRGYGTQALEALEKKVKELGLNKIMLHVFGHNEAARMLYKKMGYIETDVTMVKKISD